MNKLNLSDGETFCKGRVGVSEELSNELVRYSRAGDAFHYRWAARRCLMMINPTSPVQFIAIEGAIERKLAGEYIIDVAEYLGNDENDIRQIHYYQLKHTTVLKEEPFSLSDLKDTISGFADLYNNTSKKFGKVRKLFYLVTNRPISEKLKANLTKLQRNQSCGKRFLKTIEQYTKLSGENLASFCSNFIFMDGMGDYNEQLNELRIEATHLLAGSVDHPQIDTITALIAEKALPNSSVKISKEDILSRFGCTSLEDMFPAPPEFEETGDFINTKQQSDLIKIILENQEAIIIHAAGGVGKSVFAREIPRYLVDDSVAVIYDCFGAGKYRNRSRPRHRYRDALIQIANELSAKGLCDPLLALSYSHDDEILRKFLSKIKTAIVNLKKINQKAKIVIAIDAADNAEMAAQEFGEVCFAHELLREKLPIDCHLVMLCRTERVNLLRPNNSVKQYELLPFSEKETLLFLRKHYPKATEGDGLEFYRLTDGNPRVQANALADDSKNISTVLKLLGPGGTTIDKQIENQLDRAVTKIKEKLSPDFQEQINAICCGLATLPPFVPITILAAAAEVEVATVKSFVSELGRPIWISDSVVQFRDEPTETWFKQRFSGNTLQISNYIKLLKPLSEQYTYVAESLPHLYHQAGQYEELIELALSDMMLPKDNPIDRRNIRVYRLQFAFKAALKIKRLDDAAKIAMLAGEELAGDKRQLEIFKNNVHLIAPLQSSQKVQELGFKRVLSEAWTGSENVYAASLLSNVSEFHGEARSYLRSANNWLKIYFDERSKREDKPFTEKLKNEDITEMAFAFYNLAGVKEAVEFIIGWNPPEVVFEVASSFSQKMIDLNYVNIIVEMAKLGSKDAFFILALTNELFKVGSYLNQSVLQSSLNILASGKLKMPKLEDFGNNSFMESVISFAETCAMQTLPNDKIIKLLNHYFPKKMPFSFDSNYRNETRRIFMRVTALKKMLCPEIDFNVDNMLPEKFADKKKDYKYEQDTREYREVFNSLFPWYLTRLQVLFGHSDVITAAKEAKESADNTSRARYYKYDVTKFETAQVKLDILVHCHSSTNEQIKEFFTENSIKSDKKYEWLDCLLLALRAANRLEYLSVIRGSFDEYAHDFVDGCEDETETKAGYYVDLAKATIPISVADATGYFNLAIETVSRFGDEIVQRWQAVAALANRSSEAKNESAELAYRFIRCGELVGENVAREKYFDRIGALKICTKLSPASGIATVSRWRDRDVGWFDNQLPTIAGEIVNSGYVSPVAAWALFPLFDVEYVPDFAVTCLKNEVLKTNQQKIFNSAIDYLRLYNTSKSVWQKLKQAANELRIKNTKIDEICHYENIDSQSGEEMFIQENKAAKYEYHHIEKAELDGTIFRLNLTASADIAEALRRFKDVKDWYQNKDAFWEHYFLNIPEKDIVKSIEALVSSDQIDYYDFSEALARLPSNWKKRPSVKRKWPEIVKSAVKSSALDLLDSYGFEKFVSTLKLDNSEKYLIYEGIVEELSVRGALGIADYFFGFVTVIANVLEPEKAREVLKFSLARFELHMEAEFADGQWSEWLKPPQNPSMALTGLIWSALGAPSSEIRWKAAHCVRQLGENECQTEIDALGGWLKQDKVAAFGSNKFPFYKLNARLYLLIAFARISIDKPDLLLKHASVISHYALDDIPHILIQQFAVQAAQNIEKAFPATYSTSNLKQLSEICKSPFPRKETKNRYENISSYWHETGKVNTTLEFYHGLDINEYWYEPLGRVFGVSKKQIAELATMVILEEWGVRCDGSYLDDTRNMLWSSNQYENKTYHSHGGYPSVERYGFYLSYHSMFIVASRLLKTMPVLNVPRWDEKDSWDEWIRRYSLTRSDGFWLSDRRDAVPLVEPKWLQEKINENWMEKISDSCFLEALRLNDCPPKWLNIYGSWEYGKNSDSHRENVCITSAMVSKETSQALLNALSCCRDYRDYKLPEYQEENTEFDVPPFKLEGWIVNDDSGKNLDQFDRQSGDVYYPVYRIGKSIADELNLRSDEQSRNWYIGSEEKACICCSDWSYDISNYGDSENLCGIRMSASFEFLKKLCLAQNCELIIEVRIQRSIKESRYSGQNSENEYKPPICKIYVFSSKGELRDEQGSIRIR